MSKTLYYRETDPETGKQKWIKLEGVTSSGQYLHIRKDGKNFKQKNSWKIFADYESAGTIVYKKAR